VNASAHAPAHDLNLCLNRRRLNSFFSSPPTALDARRVPKRGARFTRETWHGKCHSETRQQSPRRVRRNLWKQRASARDARKRPVVL